MKYVQLIFGLAACAALASALVIMDSRGEAQPRYTGPSKVDMSPANRLGDSHFTCLSADCDPHGGFKGKKTGLRYATARDAVLGIAER